jgi:hypothetical protein
LALIHQEFPSGSNVPLTISLTCATNYPGLRELSRPISLFFKSIAVRRIYDQKSDTLIYVAYSRQRVPCCLPPVPWPHPVCREALEYPPPPPTRRRRHSGLTVAFNWPTVYFANAFSPIKLSSGEDFGD